MDEKKMTDIMKDESTCLKMIRREVKPETNNNYIEK